jgi:hypothetical protein
MRRGATRYAGLRGTVAAEPAEDVAGDLFGKRRDLAALHDDVGVEREQRPVAEIAVSTHVVDEGDDAKVGAR